MTKFRLPLNAFARLDLSRDDARWLRDEMNAVVAETMRAERHFVDPRDGRAVFPKGDWKAVRQRDGFSVYKERRTRKRAPSTNATRTAHADPSGVGVMMTASRALSVDSVASEELALGEQASLSRSISTASGAWTTSSNEEQDSIVAAMKEPHVPMLVAAGSVEGTLEDVCFGSLAGDDVAWRIRTAYVKDKFADARILAKIDGSTAEDPFRSLCIKWFTKEVPALVGTFIQRRDFLILEATGSGYESDGTRFGYYMIHSIKLPGVPELSDLDVIRCKVSLCFICRQPSPSTSHLFARGFSDARGEMIEQVGVALTAESIIAATLVTECAYVKKLTWLMQKKQRARQLKMLRAGTAAAPTECESCHRAVKKLSLSKGLAACQSCGCMVCSKCTVQKRIIVDVSGDGVTDRPLAFCFGCVIESKRQSSWEVATAALVPERKPLPRHHASMAKPPPRVLSRSQSAGRSNSIYSSYRRPSTASPPVSGGGSHRQTAVRPHASKSVAGVVLY